MRMSDWSSDVCSSDLPTADRDDGRDQVLAELSELLEISTFDRSSGNIVVYTASGRPRVDNGVVALSHTAAAQFDAAVNYPETVEGILYGAAGIDITTEIASGKLGGLIELRDERLVELQQELDRLTESQIGRAHV